MLIKALGPGPLGNLLTNSGGFTWVARLPRRLLSLQQPLEAQPGTPFRGSLSNPFHSGEDRGPGRLRTQGPSHATSGEDQVCLTPSEALPAVPSAFHACSGSTDAFPKAVPEIQTGSGNRENSSGRVSNSNAMTFSFKK